MYSPLLISRWMPARACVSTSSVKNTFVTPSRWMSVCADVFIVSPSLTLELYAVECVVLRHVRQDDLVAGVQSLDDFDRVDRGAAKLDLGCDRLACRTHLEDRDRAVFLAERRTADEHDVVETFELHGAVHT